MGELTVGGIVGVMVGAFVMLIILSILKNEVENEYHTAKNECEKSIPRDQSCEIYFKPQTNNDNQ